MKKKWFTAGDPHLLSYLDRKLWNLLSFIKRHEGTLVQASVGTGDLSKSWWDLTASSKVLAKSSAITYASLILRVL